MARKIVLIHKRAPGDITVLTALVRDIALSHPGAFEIDVDTSAMDLWRHNPYLTPLRQQKGRRKDVEYIKIQYGRGIRDQNYETVHFLSYFHRDFKKQCNVDVPLLYPYPDLHLSKQEREEPIVNGRYWLVFNGGKSDFTAKVWNVRKMQEVVDKLTGLGLGVVQLGSNDPGHWHPPLDGVLNLVAKTNLRDLLRLIHHADGVICPVTGAMHMAAALHRPCIVLAGGREAWWWEAYVNENSGFGPHASGKVKMPHRFLHTLGLLDCCKYHGCWRNKVVPLKGDKSVCVRPVTYPGQPVPLCLDMITPDHVMEAVMSYYTDKSLPPIGTATPHQVPEAKPEEKPAEPVGGNGQAKKPTLLNLFDDPPPTPPVERPAPTPGMQRTTARVAIPKEIKLGTKPTVRTNVTMEGRKDKKTTQVACQPGMPTPTVATADDTIFDHPDVGGKFTICVLLYGPDKFYDLHMQCLNSIIATVPDGRMDLRIGSNELNPKSTKYVDSLVEQKICSKHYRHRNNAFKYPVMREMFHDPDHPITTKWVLWFDDDTICDREQAWLYILSQAIAQHHRADNAHMFGAKFVWTMTTKQRELIKARPWYQRRPFRQHNGRPSPNGNKIIFCTGGWWAITTEAIRHCDIPDVSPEMGLTHNGGDWLIGEQLWQGGMETKAFNGRKQFLNTSSVERRGVTTPMPGEARPQGHPKLRVV